jgi:transposase InsO family protein
VISQLREESFEVKECCLTLGASRSGYYEHLLGSRDSRVTTGDRLRMEVHQVFLDHRRRYGARRISRELTEQGQRCSRSKVRKIMDEMDLVAIQPRSFKPRTTRSRHSLGYSPNRLSEGVELAAINRVWVGDITYVPLRHRFAYLALLMDLYSRRIVGWSLEEHMEESLVIGALRMAIRHRQPVPELIHHTDRGGQYAGQEYRRILHRSRMLQSMSRAADCYDNAFMESCFGRMKAELEMTSYPTIDAAKREIPEYINYYNFKRRHSSLDYQSPNSFESTSLP